MLLGRRARVAIAVLLAGVLGGIAVLLSFGGPGSGPTATSTPGVATTTAADNGVQKSSLAGSGSVTVAAREAADTVCTVRPENLTALTKIAPKSPALENLRDGLPLLRDQIIEVTAVTEGRPALRPIKKRLDRIYALWTKALAAHDAGRDKAAAHRMSVARQQIEALDGDLDAAFPEHDKECPA